MNEEGLQFKSKSIWFKNIDRGLIDMLTKIVKLPDLEGNLISVPVVIRKNEEEFKSDQYPVISIYNLYSRLDSARYYEFDNITVGRDYHTDTIYQSKPALPYHLQYQIDFWGMYQQDMNAMTLKWLSAVGKDFNIPVIDDSGESTFAYAMMRGDLSKNDIFVGESTSRTMNRLYHWYLTYRIYGYLYEPEYMITSNDMILTTSVTGSEKETQEEIQKVINENIPEEGGDIE